MSRALSLRHGGVALSCRRIPAYIVDMSQGIRPKFVGKCLAPGRFAVAGFAVAGFAVAGFAVAFLREFRFRLRQFS